ncbi:Calx-beta domain-containing protein [Sphingomonas solaris]|nr:Calx-beta domain-containing protein [Sphingomonas solaris]
MKKILLWDPRFPDRTPLVIVVSNAIATAITIDGTGAVLPEVVLGIARIGGDTGAAPDLPAIAFTVSAVPIAEGDSGTKTVTHRLSVVRNGVTGPLVANLTYTGTATAGGDYIASPASATIPAGQDYVDFTTTINSDTVAEPDETIIITATLAAYPAAVAIKTITIGNDDASIPINPGSPSGDRTASLTSRAQLPDGAAPANAGFGFPCTGLDMASDGTFWAGHGSAAPEANTGVVKLNSALTAVTAQITTAQLGLPAGSVQGVTIDDSDGSLYFILVNFTGPVTYIVHCTAAGVLISSTQIGTSMNGIAYDNQRDCLIVLYDSGNIRWQDKSAPHSVLTGVPAFAAAGSDNDQLFYDPTRKELLVTGGANNVNGTVDVYNVASSTQTLLGTITLDQCLAIEGVVRRGDDLIALSDQKTHPGSNGFNFNQVDVYANAFLPGTPSFTLANASAAEGGAAGFVLTANRNGTAGDLTGTWTAVMNGTAVAADFPAGTVPSGTWTIPNGSNATTISVTSFDDTTQESNETYGMSVSYSSAVVATGTGTINDNDAPAGSYQAESNALFARMATAPDTTRKGKIDDLIVALKNGGIWSKLDGLYVMAAHAQQPALLNWTGAKADAALVGTTPPAFTTDKGFTTDGAANYIDYGWTPAGGTSFQQNSAGMGLWINNNAAMSNGTACLSVAVSGQPIALNPRGSTGNSAYRVNQTAASGAASGRTDSRGANSVSRTAANATQMYANGAASGPAGTTASTAPVASNFLSGAGSSPLVYQAQSFGMAWMGAGLTASEHQALYDAVSTYMTAVGNQVI